MPLVEQPGSVWRLIEGDCVEQMTALPEGSVDSIVCDPPYGLEFMGKDWDAPWKTGDGFRRSRNQADTSRATPHGRASRTSPEYVAGRGFQEWCEAWGSVALRLLRPGGYMLAFGGTRTYHRLASGLEDAGFEVRDMIAWLYGSGFPKHASCLKPAQEPIMVGRKAAPKSEPLQIDACRIENTPEDREASNKAMSGQRMWRRAGQKGAATFDTGLQDGASMHDGGRWPANVALDEDAAAALDEQTGTLTSNSGEPFKRNSDKFRNTYGAFAGADAERGFYGDSGGASRFFYVAKPDTEERNVGLVGRNPHPTVKPVALMRWLCRLVTPPGGTVLDPFTGSGTTGIAALREGLSFIGIEREAEYLDVARARIIGDAPLLNGAMEVDCAA